MTDKIDFKKTLDAYQARAGEFRMVEIPAMQYLMIDGHGDPNSAPFAEAVGALYPVAYALKFASKIELGRDYVVPPLEGLWWSADMDAFTAARDAAQWDWTAMLMVPEWVTSDMFVSAVAKAAAKRAVARVEDVRLESLSEGLCVQTLHKGSFADETAVLAQLHSEFIPSQGLTMTGKHHEIYLTDVTKVSPDKLRTILRQPVAAVK